MRAVPGELSGVGVRQDAESENAHPADAGARCSPASAIASWATSTATKCSGSARRAARARTSAPSASSTCRSSSARAVAWCRTARRRNTSARCTTTSSAGGTSGGWVRRATEVRRRRRRWRRSTPPSTTSSCGWGAPARSKPTSRSRCARCSTSCGPGRFGSACSRRSSARAIPPSGPATNTCFRSWRPRTSRR